MKLLGWVCVLCQVTKLCDHIITVSSIIDNKGEVNFGINYDIKLS